jgi:hypothetical protein
MAFGVVRFVDLGDQTGCLGLPHRKASRIPETLGIRDDPMRLDVAVERMPGSADRDGRP